MSRLFALVAAAVAILAAVGYLVFSREANELVPEVAVSSAPAELTQAPKAPPVSGTDRIRQKAESTDDFGLLLATAMPLGEAGDAESAELVTRVLEYCSFYSQSPEKFASHIDFLAGQSPDQAAALRAVGDKMTKRCSNVSPGQLVSIDVIRKWQQKAAEAGSLPAMVRTAVTDNQSILGKEKGELFLAVAGSGDPDALLAAGPLLGFAPADSVSGLSVGGDQTEIDLFAWEIAACRLGADCNRGGLFMDQVCISGGGCNASSYEELIRTQRVPQGSSAVLEQKIQAATAFFGESAAHGEAL